MQNIRNRQAENDLQTKDVTSGEVSTKSVKVVTEERDAGEQRKKFIGSKLRESGSRGYQQGETRLGDKRDRTEDGARKRKTSEKRDIFSGDIRTRYS